MDLTAYRSVYAGKRRLKEALEARLPDSHPFLYKGDVFLFLHTANLGLFGFLLGARRRRQRREALLAGGYREMADVTGLEWVTNVTVNGRHPCRVVCRIERGGVLHEYRSEALRFDPGLLPGMRVPVYLDPHDERRYYVDVESAAPPIVRR